MGSGIYTYVYIYVNINGIYSTNIVFLKQQITLYSEWCHTVLRLFSLVISYSCDSGEAAGRGFPTLFVPLLAGAATFFLIF